MSDMSQSTLLGGMVLKILVRMEGGQRLTGSPQTGFALGGKAVPLAVWRQLGALDAVVRQDDGWGLSATGRALLRRRSARTKSGDDGFRAQHQAMTAVTRTIDGRVERLRVNAAESPLGWLSSRGLISISQYQAGERLRADFECAGMAPRVTMRLDGMPIGAGGGVRLDPTEAQIAAKRRFTAALDKIGPGLSDILVMVCCHLHGLETVEQGMKWPARSGKVVLGLALDRLARFYGLA